MHKHFQKPKWFYAWTYGSHLSIAHMIFIDLEKMYEKTPRKILWYVMKQKVCHVRIHVVHMYKEVQTKVRICGRATE